MSQNQAGSGSSIEPPLSADWANTIIALLALIFTIITFVLQRQKDRAATAEQREKDRQATLETERLRQQTIRLEWYREAVRLHLPDAYKSFKELRELRSVINKPDLSADDIDTLVAAYKRQLYPLRENLLEPILYIHPDTYKALRDQLDGLLDAIQAAVYNDELKLTNEGVYEREIGRKISECQQAFFKLLYAYRGTE